MAQRIAALAIINMLAFAAFVLPAAAWKIGNKDDQGFWFLYEEPVEGVYTNSWWGKQAGSSGSGKVDVNIRAEGKTVDFSGTLHIYCNNRSHSWKSGSNFDEAARVDRVRDFAPNKMIGRARQAFC